MRNSELELKIGYKPRVLVIQPRTNKESISNEQFIFQNHAVNAGVELVFANPLQDTIPWHSPRQILSGIDGVLHTGSSDIDLTIDDATGMREKYLKNTRRLIKKVIQKGTTLWHPIPVFGICLGHQSIHMNAGGEITRDVQQMETGTGRVQLNRRGKKERYLQGVPRDLSNVAVVPIFHGHKDSVRKLGRGFRVLGSTERHKFSITRKGRIFTLQGHPEVENSSDLSHAINHAVPDPKQMGSYILTYPLVDTPETGKMIGNFFKEVAAEGHKREAKRAVRRDLGSKLRLNFSVGRGLLKL